MGVLSPPLFYSLLSAISHCENAFLCFMLAFNKLNPDKVAITFLFQRDLFFSLSHVSLFPFSARSNYIFHTLVMPPIDQQQQLDMG